MRFCRESDTLAQDADVWLFFHCSLHKTKAINLRRRRYVTYATPALASVMDALIFRDDCTDFPIQLHNLVRYIQIIKETLSKNDYSKSLLLLRNKIDRSEYGMNSNWLHPFVTCKYN